MLIANPEFHWRIKHIEVQYYWIREKVDSKEIIIIYISTKDIIADAITQILDPKLFKTFRAINGIQLYDN